jgi:uncharacterized protein with HEPN domain
MKSDQILLQHIRNACIRIHEYINGYSLEEFLNLPEKQDAVIRQIEIVGEAASHISPECRERNPAIEWKKIVGMRNLLIHQYFGIDLDETYYTATIEIPELIRIVTDIPQQPERVNMFNIQRFKNYLLMRLCMLLKRDWLYS